MHVYVNQLAYAEHIVLAKGDFSLILKKFYILATQE